MMRLMLLAVAVAALIVVATSVLGSSGERWSDAPCRNGRDRLDRFGNYLET